MNTECDEISNDIIVTLAECANIVKARMPGESPQVIDNTAEALYTRINGRGLFELTELEKNARRYQWLRDHSAKDNRLPHVTQWPPADFDGDKYNNLQIKKHGLDAAVDAAMKDYAL